MTGDHRWLSIEQRSAIDLFMSGLSDAEVARRVGMIRDTIISWKQHSPTFIAALEASRHGKVNGTLDAQAAALEACYASFHQMTTQPWCTAQDRQAALTTLKGHLIAADRTLDLPEDQGTTSARSMLSLWTELARSAVKEHDRPKTHAG